jgi:hypothetical protein
MNTKQIIQSQYLAALAMFEQVIVKCPETIWNTPGAKDKFWEKAYHTLFYVHLYLQDKEDDFVPWEKQHEEEEETPYRKDEILEYLALVRVMVRERVPLIDLEVDSGFYWLPFSKLELQFYNIRHIQQHTGELYERLGTRENIELDWVGTGPA